ncbi:MAG: type II toxin-antitoxin system VapC family toxin [Nanoarchaeota archaeon]
MIGLDTTAIIDLLRKDTKVKRKLEELQGPFGTTIMNYQEIMFGLDFKNPKHKQEEMIYDQLFDELFVFPLDKASAKCATDIGWELKEKGEEIGKFDIIIASILLTQGIKKIMTRNVAHLKRIPGIEVVSY